MHVNRTGPRSTIRLPRLLSVVLLVSLQIGCVEINRLREAQSAFSEAAAVENQARFSEMRSVASASQESDVTVEGLASASTGYAAALHSLEQIEPSGWTNLRQENLDTVALTLKAMCQWKLGFYKEAYGTLDELNDDQKARLLPRDRAIIDALPGLIQNDEAYAEIMRKKPASRRSPDTASWNLALEQLLTGSATTSAIEKIAAARKRADPKHPVQVYLVQAQLAAFRNVQAARARFGISNADYAPAREEGRKLLVELKGLLNMEDPTQQAVLSHWQFATTITNLGPPPSP